MASTQNNHDDDIDLSIEDKAAAFDEAVLQLAIAEDPCSSITIQTSAKPKISAAAVSTHPFPPAHSPGEPIFNYPTYTSHPIPLQKNVSISIPVPSVGEEFRITDGSKNITLINDSNMSSQKTLKPIRVISEQSIADEVKAKSLPLLVDAAEKAKKRAEANAREVEKEIEMELLPPPQKSIKRIASVLGKSDALPREYNTGGELENVISAIGIRKVMNPVDKTIFLGFLAGLFVSFAGMFQVAVTGGTTPEFRAMYPFVPKLLTAVTFPLGLVFIIMFGGELFTGNTMILTIALLGKRITVKDLLINWLLVFLSNLGAIALIVYLFTYLTGLYEAEPHLTYITALAARKAALPYWKMVLLGVPANALVCLAFFLGLAARDMTGKILGLYLPIACFAATGWEHCVANMFFIMCGWMYGADVSIGGFCANLFFVGIGNIIGGAILIGGSEYYLYHWHTEHEPTRHAGKTVSHLPVTSRISQTFNAFEAEGSNSRRTSLSSSVRKVPPKKRQWWKVGKKAQADEEKALN